MRNTYFLRAIIQIKLLPVVKGHQVLPCTILYMECLLLSHIHVQNDLVLFSQQIRFAFAQLICNDTFLIFHSSEEKYWVSKLFSARNAPFPQHRDFQIRSDVLSPPVSLSHYSYCLRLTFPSRHYGSPNRKCTTVREVEWTSSVQVHCWDKVILNRVSLLEQSTKPWVEDELSANLNTSVREAQLCELITRRIV